MKRKNSIATGQAPLETQTSTSMHSGIALFQHAYAFLAPFLQQSTALLFLAIVVSICALQIALGTLPTRIYAHDLFTFFDGAWRVASGQIPCVDFYSGLGVLVWKPIQWALALYSYNVEAIGLARAFYTAAIGIWFLLLSRREPARLPSMILGVFVLVFLSAARPLGEFPTFVSHAMFYNRIGYALLFLILFEQLHFSRFQTADGMATESQQHKGQFWGGISTGAALACSVLLKISFLIPSSILLVLGLMLFGVNRRHLTGWLSGILIVFVFAIAGLNFRPAAFLGETISLAGVRQGKLPHEIVSVFFHEFGEIGFALTASLFIATLSFTSRRVAIRYMLATIAIIGCDLYCRATNAMRGDLPLTSFWCLSGVMLLYLSPAAANTWKQLLIKHGVALLILCPFAIPIFFNDLASSAYAAYKVAAVHNNTALHFNSPRLHSWVPLNWEEDDLAWQNENGTPLIAITNDGIRMLKALSQPHESIACFSFNNPFSFALGRHPPQGGAVWLQLGNNISFSHPLALEVLIGHPDLLMVQRFNNTEAERIKLLRSLYPDLLEKKYALIGSSEYWSLYRKNP